MDVLFCIFLVLASLACLTILALTVKDIIYDIIAKRKRASDAAVAAVEEEPIEESFEEITEEDMPTPENTFVQETDGVKVVDVVWKENRNKVYRYAANGFEISRGDIVIVPTFVAERQCEIAREAVVTSEMYTIDPSKLKFKLKPILRVVRKAARPPE